MAVKVRLSRIGKTNAPFYRIVAVDSRKKRDGEALEILGTFNPRTKELLQFNNERINAWIGLGAIPTDSVKKLQKMYKKQVDAHVA